MLDWKNTDELLDYARFLQDSTVEKALEELKKISRYASLVRDSENQYGSQKTYSGKGGFGNYLEEKYFFKENDSISQADFRSLNVELKVSPLKVLENEEIRVKERLVLNIINFFAMAKETFESSHFIEKNALLLLVFYFYDKSAEYKDLKIDLVDLWETLKQDIPQIKEDWETIADKIKSGKAHEISEGDTLYLGACTKGSTAAKSLVKQPYSDTLAPQRALCFKLGYINKIYEILKTKKVDKRLNQGTWEPLAKTIEKITSPYKGLNGREIATKLGSHYNLKEKSRYGRLARIMLGYEKSNDTFYEIDAAQIQIKSVRIQRNGSINEAMSFKNIPYLDIPYEEWEDSTFYHELTSKFIFMVFVQDEKDLEEYCFEKAILWNMSESDLEFARIVWEDARDKVLEGDYENFMGSSSNPVAHIRPKAQDSRDLMYTPQGTWEKKKCFWLNNKYIRKIISQNI